VAPEESQLVDLALEYGRDQLYKDDKRPASRVASLLWLLRQGMVNAARPEPVVDDQRYLIVLHVREGEALVTDDGRVDLGNGLVVHPRTLQRLGCDGMFQTLVEGADGRPLDLGDRVRLATPKQKAVLMAMYATCAFPGCTV